MTSQTLKLKRQAFSLHEKAILLEEMSEKYDTLVGRFNGEKNTKIMKAKAWESMTERYDILFFDKSCKIYE